MKRLLVLAAVVGGLTLCGWESTANAQGWGYGYHGPRYRPYGYGWRPGPYYPYGYRPYVAPGVFIGAPRIGIGVGVGAGYAYPPPPMYGPPYPYYGY
jgi:hypothetical protein